MRRLALIVFVTACSSADEPTLRYDGDLGQPIEASLKSEVFFVDTSVNGDGPRLFPVDTGAPVTVLDPGAFPSAGISAGAVTLKTIAFGNLTFHDVPAVAMGTCGGPCVDGALYGIVGADILRQFVVAFDYRFRTVTFGPRALPADVEGAETVVPFALEGGGEGTVQGSDARMKVPATRVTFKVMLEGKERTLVLDTGASNTVLAPAVYDEIVSDGRKQADQSVTTVTGASKTKVTRLGALSVMGIEVVGSTAARIEQELAAGLSQEIGYTVDGLLGGSYLREFLLTVDYPARQMKLRRYTHRDHVKDEFRRVGVMLSIDSIGRLRLSRRIPGTEAANDPNVPASMFGAEILTIAGQPVKGLPIEEADRLLRGAVGEVKEIKVKYQIGTEQSYAFKVEELL
jgi:predicted aspartyl protease